jgi:aspartyl/asparaginyl-tRNA synthetase
MQDEAYTHIGQSLFHFQAALQTNGSNLAEFIEQSYAERWCSDALYHVMAVRTSFVSGMQDFLIRRGLLNLERVQMSLVTDPLAHDVEHTPSIPYKGQEYVTTHSMIYSKFLACHNPRIPGVFVDSPNIRLEIASPDGEQRGKYLVDFSQLDVEVRRNRGVDLETYFDRPNEVTDLLRADYEGATRFFEEMFRGGLERVLEWNEDDLAALGVAVDIPAEPFPLFYLDEAQEKFDRSEIEARLGEQTDAPFFWIGGLMRENYDLIYPYLQRDGSRRDLASFTSPEIFNYDLCVKSRPRTGGQSTPAKEVLSGAIREWLPEPIIARLLDNRILTTAPVFRDGGIENIDELGGYGPFLMMTHRRDARGQTTFPDTFGAGIGIERALWAFLRGPEVQHIEDVTCFGKNPDSHPLYLF